MQVGFFNKHKNKYDFFEPDEIPNKKELDKQGYDTKKQKVWLIAHEGEELDYLICILTDKGIKISSDNLIKQDKCGEKIVVETDVIADRVIFRAFSKIAFNYATYVTGNNFIHLNDFDRIRKFIRYDEGKSEQYFAINTRPILYNDQKLEKFGIKTTEGHLITVEWKNRSLISKVSLFNTNTYFIKLCHNFNGIWRPIKSGHHFDIESKQVRKLFSINKKLLI